MTRVSSRGLALIALIIIMLCWPLAVHADTITVANTNDSGPGSLRDAVAGANPGDTISFDTTIFATQQTITLTSGPIAINQNLIINGPSDGIEIDGNSAGNLFTIGTTSEPTVSMSNLTLKDGVTTGSGPGGAIALNGTLTLTSCDFENNTASNGGAIFVGPLSSLTCRGLTFHNNSARANGGAIYAANSVTLSLTNTTFLSDSALFSGGAIFETLQAVLSASNCTFFQNSATGSPTSSGGALYSDGAHVTISNTIFAADTASAPGTNEIDSTTTNTNFPPTIQVNSSDIFAPGGTNPFGAANFDPKFGVFGNWGGSVPTIPLLIGSPAYGAGSPSFAPTIDARGIVRPSPPSQGAFDGPPPVLPAPTISPNGGAFTLPQLVTITNPLSAISGSTIYFTDDGNLPTQASPVYTGSFNTVAEGSEEVQAIVTAPGYTQSPPASANFVITLAPPSYPAGLQLFSSPEDYPTTPLDALFGRTGVVIAVWNPTVSQYATTPNGAAGSIRLGFGYWVRNPNPVTLTSVGIPAPTNVPFTISLNKGWNQVGQPFLTSVPLTSLTFGTNNLTFAQATTGTNPLIDPNVWAYSSAANNGAGGYVATTSLDPYRGYWIRAFRPVSLVISGR